MKTCMECHVGNEANDCSTHCPLCGGGSWKAIAGESLQLGCNGTIEPTPELPSDGSDYAFQLTSFDPSASAHNEAGARQVEGKAIITTTIPSDAPTKPERVGRKSK